jgi:hypothetical protein
MNTITIITLGILGGCVVLLSINELVNRMTYGWFVKADVADKVMNMDESALVLNPMDHDILMNYDGFAVWTISSVFAKYYISRYGIVPRGSALHKKIEHYYEVARKNSIEKETAKW